MRYLALATDYDDTIASFEHVSADVERALERLRASGRRAVLITGRTFEELTSVCPRLDPFAAIVLENGAVLYEPSSRETTVLCQPVPVALARELERRGVRPLVRGRAILATRRPHEIAVLESIRDLGLELQITFNGSSVMILSPGVNKGSGLRAALAEMDFSAHEVVGIGNAENDHSFLDLCECAVAVGNAIDSIKAKTDFTTRAANGAGVVELIDELIATDLSNRSTAGVGDVIVLANHRDGTPATVRPYGHNILVCGPSGAGKSTFATGLIERLIDRSYQLCVIDPEGDYDTLEELVVVGSRMRPPHLDEVLERLGDSRASVAVNLLGIPLDERPDFFSQLFPRLLAMRARTGGPAWILIDELHHLLPSPWGLAPFTLPQRLGETILITYRPNEVAPAIVAMMDIAVALGPSPEETLAAIAAVIGVPKPIVPPRRHGEAIVWPRAAGTDPFPVVIVPARSERLRHLRKYAEGHLGAKSFFFRGPAGKMNLRARNLKSFCELASGIDDDTWLFHLRRGDYSAWLSKAINDEDLGREVAGVEQAPLLDPRDSRRSVCDAINKRYMLSS